MTEAPLALTPTSYLVLGCVGRLGRCTSYEMKALVSNSIGYFWTFPHSQLYAEPDRLVRAGLLSEERETGGRRRRSYTLTDAGRQALASWLAEADGTVCEIRDLSLLRLFFGLLGAADDTRRLAVNTAVAHRERLEVYESMAARLPLDGHARASLELGIQLERAAVAYWEHLATDPP